MHTSYGRGYILPEHFSVPSRAIEALCVIIMHLCRLGKSFLSSPLFSTGTEPECPITITPSTMVMQHQSDRQIATCMATSSSLSNLQEIYWTSTKGSIEDNTTWWADSHKDWDARPVCKATFKGIGQCQKTLNFILYSQYSSVFFFCCHQLSYILILIFIF